MISTDEAYGLWRVLIGPNLQAGVRLVCFPYAGGSTSIFRSWPKVLPKNVEVHGIQLPGRGNRILEPPFTVLPELVEVLSGAVLPLLDRPVVFFGHSLGAILSFEVARWLRRSVGSLPAHLVVSGRRAPHLNRDSCASQESDQELLTRIRDLNGTPPDVLADPELLELILPALRADFRLSDGYHYQDESPLSCPITVLGGKHDQEAVEGRMDAWRRQTTGAFSQVLLDGGHFFIHSHEKEVLQNLGQVLARTPTR